MLGEENVLARFVTGVFRQKDPVSHYLLFRLQENEQVENLMEIWWNQCCTDMLTKIL